MTAIKSTPTRPKTPSSLLARLSAISIHNPTPAECELIINNIELLPANIQAMAIGWLKDKAAVSIH